MLNLTFRQMEYTLAALDAGSMTRAAERLGVSQPAVSQAISQFERVLGHPVFNRMANGRLEPTGFGIEAIDRARALLAEAQALERLADSGATPAGEVRLGLYTHIAPLYLARLVQAVREALPGVQLRVTEALFQPLIADLERGMLDLALTYDLGLGADLDMVSIGESAPQALLPADHPLAGAQAVRLDQIADMPLIVTGQALSAVSIEQMFQAAGLHPHVAWRVETFETLRSMVAGGLGVAVTFLRIGHDVSADGRRLATVPIAGDVVRHRLVIASRKSGRRPPAVDAVRAVAAQTLGI